MADEEGQNSNVDVEQPSRRLVFRAAGRTEEFFDRLAAHYRECERREIDAEADIRIVLPDGTEFDTGTTRIGNVSPTGALLVDVELAGGAYPTGSFSLEIRLRFGPYKGIGFRAEPVRFEPDRHGMGVRFREMFITPHTAETPTGALRSLGGGWAAEDQTAGAAADATDASVDPP